MILESKYGKIMPGTVGLARGKIMPGLCGSPRGIVIHTAQFTENYRAYHLHRHDKNPDPENI
jgi:hypothetical protein